MTMIYKYRVYCNTEGQDVFGWYESEPTFCPNSTSHSYDSSSITIVDELSETRVKIQEESTPTGGRFRIKTVGFNIAPGPDVDTEYSFSFLYPVTLLSNSMITVDSQKGDIIDGYVSPGAIIGDISTDVSIGNNVINVGQTVIDNIFVGALMELDDGVNINNLGDVIAIDKINKQITTEFATMNAFLAATPTYVKMSVHMFDQYEIGPAGKYSSGEATIGGSYLPTGYPIKLIYTNKSSDPKRIVIQIDYLY